MVNNNIGFNKLFVCKIGSTLKMTLLNLKLNPKNLKSKVSSESMHRFKRNRDHTQNNEKRTDIYQELKIVL